MRAAARRGERELAYLDESGFAPTLPTGHTWAKPGIRPPVRHKHPGRRVHVVGAVGVCEDEKRLVVHTGTIRLNAPAILDFIWRDLATLPAPRTTSPVTFFYLPRYSRRLHLVEPEWRHPKHEALSVRSHGSAIALETAVDDAVATRTSRYALLMARYLGCAIATHIW